MVGISRSAELQESISLAKEIVLLSAIQDCETDTVYDRSLAALREVC